jgi:hypothetical protein
LACIRKFCRFEADLSSDNMKGLGRVSAHGYPRLGGALSREASKTGTAAQAITYAAERVVHAEYLTTLIATDLIDDPLSKTGLAALWTPWINAAYMPPADFLDLAMGMSAYDDFLKALLARHGFRKSLKSVQKMKVTPVTQSYGGLAGTGCALAIVERS